MNKVPESVWRNPLHFIAFGFGSGASPVAPGTMGTIVAIPVFLLLQHLPWLNYLMVVLVAFLWGVILCGRVARDIGVHDHSGIVWDEFVGFWVTMFLAPAGWVWIALGFILFRVFDIFKPWPIGFLDRQLSGGLGIMLDDVVAGLYALGCLQGLAWYFVYAA